MAERLVCTHPADILTQLTTAQWWSATDQSKYVPSYNIGHSKGVVIAHLPALLLQRQKGSVLRRHLKCMRWGLPMKEGNTLRHARAETVKTKVTFKNLLHHQRCLILCDGFYMCNWRLKKYHPKRPLYYFRLSSTYYPMALAALYRERDGETSFVLLSVSTQNKPYAFIGDRVPCALDYNSWDTWIGADANIDTILGLLEPHSALEWYRAPLDLGDCGNTPEMIMKAESAPLNPTSEQVIYPVHRHSNLIFRFNSPEVDASRLSISSTVNSQQQQEQPKHPFSNQHELVHSFPNQKPQPQPSQNENVPELVDDEEWNQIEIRPNNIQQCNKDTDYPPEPLSSLTGIVQSASVSGLNHLTARSPEREESTTLLLLPRPALSTSTNIGDDGSSPISSDSLLSPSRSFFSTCKKRKLERTAEDD